MIHKLLILKDYKDFSKGNYSILIKGGKLADKF
jgi:hypothetical protein